MDTLPFIKESTRDIDVLIREGLRHGVRTQVLYSDACPRGITYYVEDDLTRTIIVSPYHDYAVERYNSYQKVLDKEKAKAADHLRGLVRRAHFTICGTTHE